MDEVYVKSMLQYHESGVFGLAINNPSKLAHRVLSYMVVCMFGGPKFCFGCFPEKQPAVSEDSIAALMYIAGHLIAKAKIKI